MVWSSSASGEDTRCLYFELSSWRMHPFSFHVSLMQFSWCFNFSKPSHHFWNSQVISRIGLLTLLNITHVIPDPRPKKYADLENCTYGLSRSYRLLLWSNNKLWSHTSKTICITMWRSENICMITIFP